MQKTIREFQFGSLNPLSMQISAISSTPKKKKKNHKKTVINWISQKMGNKKKTETKVNKK